MLKLSDLAVRQNFTLGVLQVSPSRREIVGPVGVVHVEPLVMQVFLLLADAKGEVVTRKQIFDEIWGGSEVGDYSLNRTITMIRRIAAAVAPDAFRIESIPRTGYRLLVDGLPERQDSSTRWWKPAFVRAGERRFGRTGWWASLAAAVIGLAAIAATLGWSRLNQRTLPVVVVTAAEPSARSQALSRDLVVKLGMLAKVGSGKWELADYQSPPSSADLVFRVAGTGSPSHLQATLVMLDGKGNGVLWSREFGQINVTEADLRLQLSLTAGQVLGCALEAQDEGEVRLDLLKLFLVGCAEMAESSEMEPHRGGQIMRTIVDRQPRFKPAWTRLLRSDYQSGDSVRSEDEAILMEDIRKAQKFVPDLPLLKVIEGEMTELSPFDYAGHLERMTRGTTIIPDMASLWLDEARWLAKVGRMSDAVDSTQRAVDLDPLSPATASYLIAYLAWSGRIELAREELRKAERHWPGTGALRDAQWAFHLRYGDLKFAVALQLFPLDETYIRARLEPTPANVNLVVEDIQRSLSQSDFSNFGQSLQALGEFDRTEEAFAWLNQAPPATVAEHSYLLFRPGLDDVRRDPRFMAVAKRVGLLNYWEKSRELPDFCFEPGLPYDCKKEAAKLLASGSH